jgi:hypothetical protein
MMINNNLLGGAITILKHMKVNWDDYSQYMEKLKMNQITNQKTLCPFIHVGKASLCFVHVLFKVL